MSLNCNGIRAAQRKGFFPWMLKAKPDVVCLQEIKAKVDQLRDLDFFPKGYHAYFNPAERPGYSGVAVYSLHAPLSVRYGLDWAPFDVEGRWLELDFENTTVVSLYLPSGSHSEERQGFKFEVMEAIEDRLAGLADCGRTAILCGDWNIAHKEADLKNWRGNRKNSGFLPEERSWMDKVFGPIGLVDGFRQVDEREEQYTWWSNRGQAWANNTGWRIDYQVTSRCAQPVAASIYREERFSDHAPLTMDYEGELFGVRS